MASLANGSSRAGLLVNTGIYVINIPGLNVTRITIQDNAVFLSSCTMYNPHLINHIVLDGFDLTLEDITSYSSDLWVESLWNSLSEKKWELLEP